jgi:hypothetical protein
MKRLLAIVIGLAVIAPGPVIGQSSQSTPTLVEVAKAEEARRKGVRKPAKVYTNENLKSDFSVGVPPAPATPAAPAAAGNSSSTTVPAINIPGGPAPAKPAAPETRDQAYWSGRITAARTALDRSRLFADSLQTRINSLTTDFVNRDDPVQKAKIEADRKTALAELERVRKEMESQQKEIAAIEDEARRAGVPSGWLRPGA